MIQSAKQFYQRYERVIPIAFFLLGFLFDIFTISRIDDTFTILQQAVYLFLVGIFVGIELLEEDRPTITRGFLLKIWMYREPALHFILGSLLSCYAIFYFKSASSLTSFFFIALLIGLLIVNEFKRFEHSRAKIHVAFFSLSVISYFVSLIPILLGFIGWIPFLTSVFISLTVFWGYRYLLQEKFKLGAAILSQQLTRPFFGIQALFVVLYFAHVIPPVPLSVTYMGIFHDVKKSQGAYELSYTRPWWRFWQKGDQTFEARPGDVIHCFVRVFSPTNFKEQLKIRWLYWDKKWNSAGAIVLPIEGGRDEGFRSIATKANYQPGEWMVRVETDDGREVGNIRLRVVADTSTEPRNTTVLVQ